jgi:hypothetical protein
MADANTFDVMLTGQIAAGHEAALVHQRIAKLFKVPPEKARVILAKAPFPVRRGLDLATAKKLAATIQQQAGAMCGIARAAAAAPDPEQTAPEAPAQADAPTTPPPSAPAEAAPDATPAKKKSTISVPTPAGVAELLGMLFGKDVKVDLAQSTPHGKGCRAGIFRDNDEDVRAACVYDVQLAASAAGALSMVPGDVVREAVEAGALDDTLLGNLHEVLNVTVGLFIRGAEEGMRLKETTAVPDELESVLGLGLSDFKRQDYAVSVPGYREGRLSVYLI